MPMSNIKKLIITAIIIILLASLLTTTALAYTGPAFVATDSLAVYDGPGWNCIWIDSLPRWTDVTIEKDAGYGWYKISYNGKTGYVAGYYLLFGISELSRPQTEPKPTATPKPTSEPKLTPKPTPTPTPETPTTKVTGKKIVNAAKEYIGTPYLWGGESPQDGGFDCSGLVYAVYGQFGIKINRVAQSMYYNGNEVSLNDLKPGDILCFGSSVYSIWHVGIYAGDGMIIHSSWGDMVRMEALSELTNMQLIAARRII